MSADHLAVSRELHDAIETALALADVERQHVIGLYLAQAMEMIDGPDRTVAGASLEK